MTEDTNFHLFRMHNGGPRYSPAPSCDETEVSDTPPSEECNGNSIEIDMCELKTNTLKSLVGTDKHHKPERFILQERLDRNLPSGEVIFVKSCVSQRTTLEKYLFVVCCALLIGCVIMTILLSTKNQEDVKLPSINGSSQDKTNEDSPNICLTEDCVKTAAALLNSMDTTMDPCDDFFQFACGKFNKDHVIPDDKSIVDTFTILHKKIQTQLRGLLETPISAQDTLATKQVKNLYKSCINTSSVERNGDKVLRQSLRMLGGWPVADPSWGPEKFDLEDLLSKLRMKFNTPVMLETGVGIDDKNSTRHMFELDQPLLGLPSRDYFLDKNFVHVLNAYLDYMTSIAMIHGANHSYARSEMARVLDFEMKLANITVPETLRTDRQEIVKVMSIKQLEGTIPQFSWRRYLSPQHASLGEDNTQVAIISMDYMKQLPKLIAKTDKRVVTNYLMWILVMSFAPELTSEYREKRMELQKALDGVTKQESRWIQCVEFCNNNMGMALGSMFVTKYFDKESKTSALDMISDIREAFKELLDVNDWMDDETRVVAKEKAATMTERIGYPDFILNDTYMTMVYENMSCSPTDYFGNVLKLEQDEVERNMMKLTQLVNHKTWEQRPAVVNAFYNPNINDILFPAGILQPLFYSRYFPKSLNYGGIGVVIGHEITHGFDAKGRQYNKDGNMQQWWNNKTINAFKKRAKCMEQQYSNFTMERINVKIDGLLTLGENIADNGGVKQSFKAYQKWVSRNGEEPLLPAMNMTHNQLFFLNYAQIWCGTMRDETALKWVRTEVHSPNPVRARGPLSNSQDFAEAYNCPLGSKMNPVEKCTIW